MPHICARTLRGGDICRMTANHRGRCSSVVHYCEACGNVRRGRAHAKQEVRLGDGTVDEVFEFCFMCSVVEGAVAA